MTRNRGSKRLRRILALRDMAWTVLRAIGHHRRFHGDVGGLWCEGLGLHLLLTTPFQRLPSAPAQPAPLPVPPEFRWARYGLDVWDEAGKTLSVVWDARDIRRKVIAFRPGAWEQKLEALAREVGHLASPVGGSPYSPWSRPQVEAVMARRLASARDGILSQFRMLPSTPELETLRSARAIFGVTRDGALVYPAFQLDAAAQPKPVIGRLIQLVGTRRSGWALALWLVVPNRWLESQRPVDLLDTDPESVLQALRDDLTPVG